MAAINLSAVPPEFLNRYGLVYIPSLRHCGFMVWFLGLNVWTAFDVCPPFLAAAACVILDVPYASLAVYVFGFQ